ncbi:isoprenylcysteine carboxyl methyltransferase family protein [Virgibacillus kimchii]
MPLILWILFLLIIIQRLIELKIAGRNEKWMKEKGAIEIGKEHYKWFILIHSLFFFSILIEIILRNVSAVQLNYVLFILFLLTQVVRIWCISSLGKFWNTKIIVLPGYPLVKKGPYKYVKHPNYIIVGVELFIIPLLFGAYVTAVIFPILHILLLRIRIPCEEKALNKAVRT